MVECLCLVRNKTNWLMTLLTEQSNFFYLSMCLIGTILHLSAHKGTMNALFYLPNFAGHARKGYNKGWL